MNIKRLFACLFFIIFSIASTQPVSASTQDFYFSSADFDYLLTKDGKLKVTETLTAEFPDTDQNHGITRVLPYKSRKGSNIILPSTDSITVTRNGESEPISKIEKESDGYYLYIGRASEYVHDTQVYKITYTYENIVTEFTADQKNVTGTEIPEEYQELYLNVNGDGWAQRFDEITATLRFGDGVRPLTLDEYTKITSFTNSSSPSDTGLAVWCYPPSGVSCSITSGEKTTNANASENANADTKTANSITFSATNIPRKSSLTFSVEFPAGTIAVPDQKVSYYFLITSLIILALLAIFIFFCLKSWRKNAPVRAERKAKKAYYNSRFIAPQYAPLEGLSVAGAKELYLGPENLKSEFVATLLELAVRGDVSIIKNDSEKEQKSGLSKLFSSKSAEWSIKINSLAISNAETKVLKLLNGSHEELTVGQTINIKNHTANSYLASLVTNFATATREKLRDHGFLKSLDKKSGTNTATIIFIILFLGMCFLPLLPFALALLTLPFLTLADMISLESLSRGVDEIYNDIFDLGATQFLAGPLCIILSLAILISLIILIVVLATRKSKFDRYTEKGLDASKHLDGLYLYVKMAEADRLQFLQSVDGADVSNKGIVKLYEKLLPYAALFGLEKSWMRDLEKYYQLDDVEDPTWCNSIDSFSTGFASGALASSISNSINSATPSASGGSGSSGGFSSGSGGGGSSGGGSGGGGGGGW